MTSTPQPVLNIVLPKLYYYAGEVVSGKLVYSPKQDKSIHGIHIHFTGFEFCENHMLADVPFQKKWILDGSTTVHGHKCVINRAGHQTTTHKYAESEGITVKAGDYSWPFSFQIPKNIPPSCEFKAGKVKIDYSIAALVDIPWAKSIRVVQHLRVGLAYVVDPERPPTLFKNEKSFLIHNNVPQPGKQVLFMQAYVDKPVTYTGDKITLFATVNNNSGRNVHSLKVKLKQLWSYGSGYFEKFTIAKIKHKDRKFPLSEGEYKAEIPMVVPNCDLRPTISNATLIRVSYHITLIASIRGGLDLRVRVPLIMASFPPATKKQMEEKKEEKKEEKPVEVKQAPLIDWDAPTPEQQSIAPLIPVMGSEFLPLPPSLTKQPSLNDADFFSQDVIHKAEPHPQFIQDLQLNTNVSKLGEIVNEMEAATHWAAAGQLEHAVDVDPNLDAQKTQQSLLAATKNVSDAIARLLEAAKHRPEQFMAASQDVAGNVSVLAHVAKEAASQLGEPQMQSGILHGSKTIALGSQQLLLQGKEIVNYDPFTSAYSKEFMVSTMEQTAKAVQDSCANLASFAQQAYAASYAKVNQVLEAIDALEKFLAAYNNPFGGESNDNATLEDVDKIARQFAQTTTQFVAACHGSSDDTIHGAQYLTKSLRDLLLNVKGVAKKYPVISQQLTDNAKAAGQSTLQLFKFTATALKKGSTSSVEKELNLGARENHQRAANIISLVGTEMQRRNVEIQEESKRKEEEERARKEAERALKEKVEFEDRAEQELIKAAEAIAVAAQKLQQAMKQSAKTEVNDPFSAQLIDHKYDVIDASSSVAIAISELLRAASLAQAERAKQARDTRPENPYHKDPAWTEGLISAAKQVVALIEQLVTATTGEKQEEEVVISLARAITAATAQLMSAERAKGDLEGEAHKRLQAAARAVAKTTTELVQKMKDASEHKQAPQPTTEDAKADTANKARAQELEAQIKIAKLEKELEKARIDMHKLRKDKYGNT